MFLATSPRWPSLDDLNNLLEVFFSCPGAHYLLQTIEPLCAVQDFAIAFLGSLAKIDMLALELGYAEFGQAPIVVEIFSLGSKDERKGEKIVRTRYQANVCRRQGFFHVAERRK
jgi:hypothetical protein